MAAVVVLDAHEQPAFQRIDLIEARDDSGSELVRFWTRFPWPGWRSDRGQVVLDHQRPLDLEFREPVSGIAFVLSDPRHQAMLSLTLFRGEHEVGRQVFAYQTIPGSRVALIQEGRMAVAAAQDFDRDRAPPH